MRLRKITYVLFVIIMMFVFSSCKKECKHVSSDWIVDEQKHVQKKVANIKSVQNVTKYLLPKKYLFLDTNTIKMEFVQGVVMY